ncbi:D-alanine--D-alanine ligase family protein [Planctomonas psychrotolerans]|uniref:D-alanine--D-alanine ligase family protein n=1 Tax=Planctomonas psychrotolerans TaxID=2528712 RepID=UPI00123B140F|nr:D-alanine--D-alanine ligase [Planctomonas psychrotolerans]
MAASPDIPGHPSPLGSGRRYHVAVIGGGRSSEHDVSVASALGVATALRERGHRVTELTIGRTGEWCQGGRAIEAGTAVQLLTGCDVAFPVLHGVHGEDGTVAGLLDMIGVPAVGSPVRPGALAMDKAVTKLLARHIGVAVADGVTVTSVDAATALANIAFPVVVKPSSGGSSHGVSIANGTDDLAPAVELALTFDREAVVEAFVSGREIDIAVYRDARGVLRAGAALEISVAHGEVFDAESKYDGSARFVVPAPLSSPERQRITEHAHRLYDTFGCRGVARFDFFLTNDGPVLNEINTSPGMTEQSQVPRMYGALGMSYDELVDELVAAACEPAR